MNPTVFSAYAHYYDLLYHDKDYQGEVDYVSWLLDRHAPGAECILELGCGTGLHAALLAKTGRKVHGIDLSPTMLEAAQVRAAAAADRLSFSQGDARSAKAERTFDAVISLFHVVSYQTTNDDLIAIFANAASHLAPGGVFVFDYWYGPAVLTDRPVARTKRMQSTEIEVIRNATPVLHVNESCVDVNYDITVREKANDRAHELHETHRMRYLFLSDIDFLARQSGMKVVASCEWLTDRRPSDASWCACSVLRK